MHCRDLNPYVDSALADWRKSNCRHGQLPRVAAGVSCGSSPSAAGMQNAPPCPCSRCSLWCSVVSRDVIDQHMFPKQCYFEASNSMLLCSCHRHLFVRHERRQRACHLRASHCRLSSRRARICWPAHAASPLACCHSATPAGSCPGRRPRPARLRLHPAVPGAVVPVGSQGVLISAPRCSEVTQAAHMLSTSDESTLRKTEDLVWCDWMLTLNGATLPLQLRQGPWPTA